MFFDLTISLSKSISIFHASLGENVRLAREAGDQAGDEYWSALVAEVDVMIWQSVRVGFDYFQREAGYTRTGSHNTRVQGRETGQWHEADLVVAHWLQHTSRDGDMQLHIHSQIAHTAKTAIDGNGGPRTRWATTSTSAPSPRSSPSTSKKPSPAGSAWNGPPAMTATASRSRASPAR